jgi:hypothetical protein
MISIVINCDTRKGFQEETSSAEKMFDGTRSEDFLIDGVLNKQKFFEGYETETILFIDEHEPVPQHIYEKLKAITDTLVIRKHTSEPNFNDFSYISALALARGEYVAHFDQDSAAFTATTETPAALIRLLEDYRYDSYTSYWSPGAVHDDSFNYMWCSTRFFICKRETLDFTEIIKCQRDYEYYCETYKPSRACHWAEHILAMVAGKSVYYPPMETDRYMIFCWGSYTKGTLRHLNNVPYEDVKTFVSSKGGIVYPNDVHA